MIRHPAKIELHDRYHHHQTIIQRLTSNGIDGRGDDEAGLILEEGVLINRNCMLQAKTGQIRIGKRSSFGSNS